MKTETVKVLRPFFWQGKPTKVGDILAEVPATFAAELVSAKKAERVDAKASTQDKAAETAQETKGGKNAR